MKLDVIGLEKKIVTIAVLTSIVHLCLIAYAALKLNITVPGCVENPQNIEKAEIISHGEKRYELRMISKMWAFEPKVTRLPVGSKVDIFMVSKDVNHGFQIVGTNVNVMAVPGVVTQAQVEFRKPGSYRIVCNEYCGTGHHDMYGIIEVSEDVVEPEIRGGYEEIAMKALNIDEHPGKPIMDRQGCLACHSLDGSVTVGPSFKGLYGKIEELTDGTKVKVDEAYLKVAINDPQKQIVKGFNVQMPPLPLNDEEITHVINLIKVLK